ncbi:MAG TPA: EamA/RhaT family transporter [Sutterella sp.]|nr:EamA/RhaT family transporter [Sutterella sp.]
MPSSFGRIAPFSLMIQSLWMLVAAFFFACMSACVKYTSGLGEAGTFEIVFYRSFIGMMFILAIVLTRGYTVRTKHLTGHLKRSILGTIAFTMWFASMAYLPLGTSTTLNYTAPIFIAITTIIVALRNKQKAPWLLGLAILAGFIGICLILRPSVNEEQLPWAMLGLAAGALGPVIFFQIKQLGRLKEPSYRIVFYFSLVGTIWGFAGMFLIENGLAWHSTETMLGLLGVGTVAILAQLAMTRAYAYGNMMLSACLQFATIPFSEILSAVVFHETLPAVALAGMGLILVSGCSATVITKRMEQRKAERAAD